MEPDRGPRPVTGDPPKDVDSVPSKPEADVTTLDAPQETPPADAALEERRRRWRAERARREQAEARSRPSKP